MFTKEDVSLFRSVNGVNVPLSDEERQALADEWNTNTAGASIPVAPKANLEDVIAILPAEQKAALGALLAAKMR